MLKGLPSIATLSLLVVTFVFNSFIAVSSLSAAWIQVQPVEGPIIQEQVEGPVTEGPIIVIQEQLPGVVVDPGVVVNPGVVVDEKPAQEVQEGEVVPAIPAAQIVGEAAKAKKTAEGTKADESAKGVKRAAVMDLGEVSEDATGNQDGDAPDDDEALGLDAGTLEEADNAPKLLLVDESDESEGSATAKGSATVGGSSTTDGENSFVSWANPLFILLLTLAAFFLCWLLSLLFSRKSKATSKLASASSGSAGAKVSGEGLGRVFKERPAVVDDLTKIGGVDANDARRLNEAGIWHYDQLRGMTAQQRANLQRRLNLPRIRWYSLAGLGGESAASAATDSKSSLTATKPGAPVTSKGCLLYTSPSPRDKRQSRMPSSA